MAIVVCVKYEEEKVLNVEDEEIIKHPRSRLDLWL
jgi:hypothetical protein